MKLHQNQLKLIRHLARFGILDYPSCLQILDTDGMNDRVALSYAFRPLTKNNYLSKHKDESVTILSKGRALFPEEKQFISVGGGSSEIKRIISVSRVAALLEQNNVPSSNSLLTQKQPYFIPSACWRRISDGILSTTRFAGMLIAGDTRLAIYDIGNGDMEWQVRAESSLFYNRYRKEPVEATGMLFICSSEARDKTAIQIIRQTMWNRRQLIGNNNYTDRVRPVKFSHAPIRLRSQYKHVYLTTPETLADDIKNILGEKKKILYFCDNEAGTLLSDPACGDYECQSKRYFVNITSDLLKFVYFFSATKSQLALREKSGAFITTELQYAIIFLERDRLILRMYQDLLELEGLSFYVYRP